MELTNAALVDCTVGPTVVDAYPAFIDADLHIITPNKWANVLPWRRYATLMEALAARKRHFLFEANVGAGLPIMSTLRDLIASGDEIVKIEGILSGTLSYLFNTFDGTVPFSALVREAHRMGFTEPDPREDLSGQDVARKLLILGRQIGLKMDLDEVQVDSLVPKPLARGKYTSRFLTDFARYDADMAARVERAAVARRGAALRRHAREGPRTRRAEGISAPPPGGGGEGQRQRHRVHHQALCAHAARRAGPGRGRRRHGDGRVLGHPEAAPLPAALNGHAIGTA